MMKQQRLLLAAISLLLSPAIIAAETPVITPGVGAEGIRVGVSTEQDVIARYGTPADKIKHIEYSYQLKYPALGMSFYYCQQDPAKKLFAIEYHRGSTSDGIVIGRSSMADVQKAHHGDYGDPQGCDDGLCRYGYDSVIYYTQDSAEKLAPGKQTVVEVDVQPDGFLSCDSDDGNQKPE